MNTFKLQAYIREFPFLKEIIGNSIPNSVRIKRADENLLRFTPRYYYHNGSMGQTEVNEKVHFVLADGPIILDAVEQEGDVRSNYSDEQPRSWEGETVLESIDRHGVTKNLNFIVVENYYLDDWEGNEYMKEHSFCIYKTPKDTSFRAEIEKTRVKALVEVRAEADF